MRRRFYRNNYNTPGDIVGGVQRFITDTTFIIPSGVHFMDAFLVGGGGGGGSWYNWGHMNGGGGNGGCILYQKAIPVVSGQIWNISIGKGGKHSTNTTPLQKTSTDGGVTSLYLNNDIKFQAGGGRGGTNSANQNSITAIEFMRQYGEYHIYTGDDGTEYYQGPLMSPLNENRMIDARNLTVVEDVAKLPIYDTTAKSLLLEGRGIPEFLEKGNPTHAVSAPTKMNIAAPATYGPAPSFIKTNYPNSTFGTYSGGGYGAGGNSGWYAFKSDITYGGDGVSGIVCIRFRR